MTYVERLQLCVSLPQHPPLEPPRRNLTSLVRNELLARNGENVVKLLQGPLLGFRDKEEDHDECADVETGVEAEGTYAVLVTVTMSQSNENTHRLG